jgi:hypothetical protein
LAPFAVLSFQWKVAVPQSLSNVLVHVIYSTKNREPFLRDVRLRRELEAYLVGTL